jgi:aarF domain-containing kinase
MAMGVVGESWKRATSGAGSQPAGSLVMNPANIERLVKTLSKMRGAALKMGQMLSFQGWRASLLSLYLGRFSVFSIFFFSKNQTC